MDQLKEDQVGPFLVALGWAMGLVIVAALVSIFWSDIRRAWPWLRERRGALIGCGLLVLGAACGAVAGGAQGVLIGVIAGALVGGFALLAVRSSQLAYVAQPAHASTDDQFQGEPFTAFELPERLAFVQGLNVSNADLLTGEDYIILDTLARQMAAGTIAESSAITAVYDGRRGLAKVSKGGAVAYTARRDMLRAIATVYGWQAPVAAAPEPARLSPIAGREIPASAKFIDDEVAAEVH